MRFALIGHPIGHSVSPYLHSLLFSLRGIDASYEALDLEPDELDRKADELSELDGFNVTIPYKQRIIRYLQNTDSRAAAFGSVNTVKTHPALTGTTTDGIGFTRALRDAGIPLGGRVCVLGSGGAARVFVGEAVKAGCEVRVSARNECAARELCAQLGADFGEPEGDFDLLINATPLGMYPKEDGCAASDRLIARCTAVFDSVYNPSQTLLLRRAAEMGKRCAGGLMMLVHQAAAAQEFWLGVSFSEEELREAAKKCESYIETHFRP